MLNIFAPRPEDPNQGVLTTPAEALAVAEAVGAIGGCAVEIYVEPLITEQIGEKQNHWVRLANGRTFNAKTMSYRIENAKRMGTSLADAIGQDYNQPGEAPAGVAYEITERELVTIKQWLANAGILELAPQGAGCISPGATDVEAAKEGASLLSVKVFPPNQTHANAVIFLNDPNTDKHGPVIVNAAMIQEAARRAGIDGARAFAQTRQGLRPSA